MNCAKCHAENRADSKFCAACGAPLHIICNRCHHENGAGSRFCSQCGNALTGGVPNEKGAPAVNATVGVAAGERRQATIMMSDVSGYTALSEQLELEEVDEIGGRIRQVAAQIVEQHGGVVNQFVGDEVVALFGMPNTHEDDPARAVRAALKLHADVRQNLASLQTRVGEPIVMHTGINTGLIIAQYRDDREGLYRLTGDAVNTAARLRSLAGADEIVIGPKTQRLVRPYFDMAARSPVQIKGKAVPIVPYHVYAETRINSRFDAARQRGFKTYIGRGRELAVLRSNASEALAGAGRLVTVEGEPGIGKSRLMYEFLRGLDRKRVTVPQGRCQSYGSEIPYFPFLDALRRGLHIREEDSQTEALRKATANIREIDASLERYLPFYLHLLSIPSDLPLPKQLEGAALRRMMEEALGAMLTLTAKSTPMVLVLENWHWSDAASQSALRHLLRLAPSCSLMILVSYRPGYGFDFGPVADHTAIRLDRLSESETEELIRSITGAGRLPPGLSALLYQSTDGNPLFIEEACYSLIEAGTVSIVDRSLQLHQPLEQLLLPDTVQAVIRARLDRLDDDEKEVVRLASAIGRIFNYRILQEIYRGQTPLDQALETLQAQEIIRQTKILPEPEYRFRHALTREVAYDTLLQQQRRKLHEAVGIAIEGLYPERLEEHASILAHHYARSSRADKAVHFAIVAGDRAARLHANTEAAIHFSDALSIARAMPDSDQTKRWQIDAIVNLSAVGTAPRDMTCEREKLELAGALAEELNDRPRLAQALYWIGRNHYALAQLEKAIEFAQRSLRIADELGDAALAAPPVNLMGRAYWQLSDFRKSAVMTERSVQQMRSVGNTGEEATAAGFVSALFGYMGEFEKALSYSDHSIKIARALGNPFAEAASLHYRGIIRDQQGLWRDAIDDYLAAQRLAERSNDIFRVYLAKFMQGRAESMSGDVDAGRISIEGAIALAGKIGTTFILGQAKTWLADCHLAQGSRDEARALCMEALDLAKKAGDKFTEALALRTLADSRPASGSSAESRARDALDRAIAIQESIGARPELARSCAALAVLCRSAGTTAEWDRWRHAALDLFRTLGMTWDEDRLAAIGG